MTANIISIESRAREIATLSTVSSQPHVWEAMKLLVEMADEIERLRSRLASSSSALDDMRRWAETEIDARKRERDEVHAQLATVRAQASELLAVNDEQEKECDRLRGEVACAGPAMQELRTQYEQRLTASQAEVERLRAALPEAFDAGYAFAYDQAEVSEHDGWHRTDPRIEWPSDEKLTAARLRSIGSLIGQTRGECE
jgi:hypothetical protein